MQYPDHITRLELVREHQAELRRQAQRPQREEHTGGPLTMAALTRAVVDRLTTGRSLSWRRRRALRRAAQA